MDLTFVVSSVPALICGALVKGVRYYIPGPLLPSILGVLDVNYTRIVSLSS